MPTCITANLKNNPKKTASRDIATLILKIAGKRKSLDFLLPALAFVVNHFYGLQIIKNRLPPQGYPLLKTKNFLVNEAK